MLCHTPLSATSGLALRRCTVTRRSGSVRADWVRSSALSCRQSCTTNGQRTRPRPPISRCPRCFATAPRNSAAWPAGSRRLCTRIAASAVCHFSNLAVRLGRRAFGVSVTTAALRGLVFPKPVVVHQSERIRPGHRLSLWRRSARSTPSCVMPVHSRSEERRGSGWPPEPSPKRS